MPVCWNKVSGSVNASPSRATSAAGLTMHFKTKQTTKKNHNESAAAGTIRGTQAWIWTVNHHFPAHWQQLSCSEQAWEQLLKSNCWWASALEKSCLSRSCGSKSTNAIFLSTALTRAARTSHPPTPCKQTISLFFANGCNPIYPAS